MTESPEDVLAFWFADARDSPERAAARLPVWFEADPAFDERVRAHFAPAVALASEGGLADWEERPPGALALVLLLDQLPRNIFRGSARAFATDSLALAISRRTFASGASRALTPLERIFLLLPLEHAESLDAQRECVARAREIAASAPPAWSAFMASFVPHAEQHRAIVERFGRFPHRNRALGRISTPDEVAYLAEGAGSFGQGG